MKKFIGTIMLFIVFCLSQALSVYATTKTQDEAVNWAKSQVGQSLDYDGAYGAQCVDLIAYYYQFLGTSTPGGNAKDYASNALPAGWQRINYGSGFSPAPGDVIVWSYSKWAQIDGVNYGHIGIVTYSNSYEIGVIDQNRSGFYVTEGTYPYESPNMQIACVLRPDFGGGSASVAETKWTGEARDITETDATLSAAYTTSVPASFYWKGCNIFYENGEMFRQLGENVSYTGNSCENTYRLSSQGITLSPGTTYKYQFYANVNGTDLFDEMRSFTTKKSDNQAPVISDISVSDISPTGYTVNFVVTDNVSIDRIQIPTWTLKDDQDDLIWYTYGENIGKNKVSASYTIKIKNHNYETGQYISHIYAWDSSGNEASCNIDEKIIVPEKNTAENSSVNEADISEKPTADNNVVYEKTTETTTYRTIEPKNQVVDEGQNNSSRTSIQLQVNNPFIIVNGVSKSIDSNNTKPIIVNNRTLLPIRAVIEGMGGTADWDPYFKMTILEYNGKTLTLTINDYDMFVNGSVRAMDTAPIIVNGRTMLPIRFIAEALGFNVEWDHQTKTTYVYN